MALKTLFANAAVVAGTLTGNPWVVSRAAPHSSMSGGLDYFRSRGSKDEAPVIEEDKTSVSDQEGLEAYLAARFPEGEQGMADNDLIGGFHTNMLRGASPIVSSAPEYREGDEVAELVGLNTESMVRLQDRMAAIGLLTGTWFPGQMDARTVSSFKQLLSMSNARGYDWGSLLTSIEQDPRMQELLAEGKQGFVAPSYLAPDYAEIAQQVKGVFRSRLGRDPDEGELAQIQAEVQGWDRQMFDQKVEGARRQHEGQGGTTIQGVDPVNRFKEMFESRYKGELDIVDEREDHKMARHNLDTSVNTLRQMARGGF